MRAACMLAGVSLREAARSGGLSIAHLHAVARGEHPLTSTDARDLGAVLGCPPDWLLAGWEHTTSDE